MQGPLRPGLTPSDVRALLSAVGRRPDKSLGQHFLIDRNILANIVEAAEIAPGDAVFEPGPGLGALTESLRAAGARVVAVEIDRTLARLLTELFAGQEQVQIVHGDALRFDPAPYLPGPFKLVGNLPYQIASRLILRFVAFERMRLAVAMVQDEVARRLAARPGGKEYGVSSVLVQARAEVETVARLGRTVFYPPPRVDSAVVRIRPKGGVELPPAFDAVVKAAFAQRRKTLRRNLQSLGRACGLDADRWLEEAGIDPDLRAEDVSPDGFLQLARLTGR